MASGKEIKFNVTKPRTISEHDLLRAAVLLHGRCIDRYTHKSGANVAVYSYNGAEYSISDKPIPEFEAEAN